MNSLSHFIQDIKEYDFIFGLVQLMYCKYAKVNLQRGGSHTDSTECIKKSNHKPQKIQIINVFNMW